MPLPEWSPVMEWHYAIGEQQFGPVSADEIRRLVQAGTLKPTDLAWCSVMKAWEEIGSIRVLGIERMRERKQRERKPKSPPSHRGAIKGIGGIC